MLVGRVLNAQEVPSFDTAATAVDDVAKKHPACDNVAPGQYTTEFQAAALGRVLEVHVPAAVGDEAAEVLLDCNTT